MACDAPRFVRLQEKVIRRVVGMHAVSNLAAEAADELMWYTIASLKLKARVRTRVTTCDGASAFRLVQKSNTWDDSGAPPPVAAAPPPPQAPPPPPPQAPPPPPAPPAAAPAVAPAAAPAVAPALPPLATGGHPIRRGTANVFISSAVPNDVEDDNDAELFMFSDQSHAMKKANTNWYSRDMGIPDTYCQMVLQAHPQPGAPPGPEVGETVGIETYVRVWARLWELLGDSHQPAFWTGDAAKDLRIRELEDILRWFQMWHEYNAGAAAYAGMEKKERSAQGMTHQLYYDTHSMVDAFLRLLQALENDHPNGFRIFARRLCQDSLESLFGRLRQANGGQRDLSVKSIVDAVDKVEEKSRRKAKRVAALEERRNSGTRADDADGPAAPKKGKKEKGAAAGATPAAMALAPAPPVVPEAQAAAMVPAVAAPVAPAAATAQGPQWLADHRIVLPADAEARHARAMAGPQQTVHRVRWSIFRKVQKEDEARLQRGKKKRMRKISTAKHINRTSFSALKVDIAIHVLSMDVADQLRLRRHGGWVD